MIDKNDVKMPVYKEIGDDKIDKVVNLLDLLSDVADRQELRLKSDYYARFHWFGGNITGQSDRSYFSYQEEAVYDFMFNLNKSGILSDQVGMGKTIEAGMIISELASRNELDSLLIVVPNEIMAEKWEYELASKFGIQPFRRRNADGVEEIYPSVTALKNYDDFCKCVFTCLANEKLSEFYNTRYTHKYDGAPESGDTLEGLIRSYIKADIEDAVKKINRSFEDSDMDEVKIVFKDNCFSIAGTKFSRPYVYDDGGEIATFLRGAQSQRNLTHTINTPGFIRRYDRIIKQELKSLYILIGDYFTTLPGEVESISRQMAKLYPFLVIPISFSSHEKEQIIHHEFLNRPLLPKLENYKHKYIIQDAEGNINEVFEEYRIIDFFIDAAYETLIVDEVHDYIDVCAKVERLKFHNTVGYDKYPSSEFNRYELFDDYYFIKKSSLYKKLKNLADKADRKIFLTATPIKSDMVDFYLLTLLASNKDSEAYSKISANLKNAYRSSREREAAISRIYNAFKDSIEFCSAKYFCDHNSTFLKQEFTDEHTADSATGEVRHVASRYRYAYFNNTFLRRHLNDPELIKKYMLSQLSYMSMEEVVLELILSFNAENDNKTLSSIAVRQIFEELEKMFSNDEGDTRQTCVVFRTLFNNNIKIRFEEDFTNPQGKPIKRIRELLENDEGARKWNRTYRKYGIRHTRHQTYNLAKCQQLHKLSDNRIERYQNLPIWPRRDGKVIFLVRDDVFFDCFLDVHRDIESIAESHIKMEDLPNYDRLNGSEEEKRERFESAKAIFDYINSSMSGGDDVNHMPSSSRYESVDLDDSGMVDYKLALINKLMTGREKNLGSVSKKVLLFAENGREEITEWFKYQRCAPLYKGEKLDDAKLAEYKKKWESYMVDVLGADWKVSEDAEDLSRVDGNLLIIIDPKRYEKGVDLQKADTIINFDINYCPLKMEQRIGRIDRIRPSGNVAQINIISFVPMNDMSGYVINFFANELKMFTQWMGETTGIVSVPEEEGNAQTGEDVSFEGKVYNLEKYYNYLYNICKGTVDIAKSEEMAQDFSQRFGTDDEKTKIDFRFLSKFQESFDQAFRNSVSTNREGYTTPSRKKVMRFNSKMGPFVGCNADKCQGCPSYSEQCLTKNRDSMRNVYTIFDNAVRLFFKNGETFYKEVSQEYTRARGAGRISGDKLNRYKSIVEYADKRAKDFKAKSEVIKKLPTTQSNTPFIMPFDDYKEVIRAMKSLYWDTVVQVYIKEIIDQFHNQCDSVLSGARLFEKFVKTLSIADFMNNMEGTV